jgi:NADH:ubiquinone oxidoreductase subunit 2 (subunit N)
MLVAVVVFLINRSGSKAFTATHKRLALIGLILAHLQLVVGLLLYFLGPKGFAYTKLEGFMQNSVQRLYAVEHISIMILAIVLITVGYSTAKRAADDQSKFKKLSLFYGLGLVLVLSRIPWNAWLPI